MKKRKDLLAYLKSKGLRMTASKQLLIQFFLNNQNKRVSAKQVHEHLSLHLPSIDRTTVYRNIEKFIELDLIQELDLPKIGKAYQYIFDKKIHHFYICKACGEVKKGDEKLFNRIEKALKDIHDFSKAKLSVVFYGYCSDCATDKAPEIDL